MHVCILTHTFPRFPGDTISSIFMAELAQSLVVAGNKVWVLMPYTPLYKESKTDYEIVTYKYILPKNLHKLGYSETLSNDMGFPLIMWLLSPFMYISCFFKLLYLVKKERIDVINAHWILPNGFIAGAVSLLTGTPVVSTLPGSDVYMARKNPFFNLMARLAVWRSNWITSNSPQLIADLARITQTRLEKASSTIAYGIGSDKFKPDVNSARKTRELLGFMNKDIVILGVGRLVAKKGFKYLIQASREIVNKHKNVYFVLIGDGDQAEYLKNRTHNLGVAGRFRFLGSISYTQMKGYYNMADIFILPSIRDEKGNLDDQSVAVMDAMACAKPVITSDFLGYRTIIENGKDGFLVREKDSKGIAKQLLKLIESRELREAVGGLARNKILQKFSWSVIARSYTQLFRRVTSKYYSTGVPKILNEAGRERIAKQIWGVLSNEVDTKNAKKLTCLDVGSSSGIIANHLSSYFKSITAVDIDEAAILRAKSQFDNENLSFEVMDIENLKFKSESFDVVVCNQVYNFVEHPQKLVDEIYRVLKPGGICYFGARNRWALIEPQYTIPFGSWFPWLLPYGKNYMGYSQIKKLLGKFMVDDLTLKILRDPAKYGFVGLRKYSGLARILPLELVLPLVPNFILVLKKKKP